MRVNYDALRVEMARMDASMQDAADSRYDASGSSTGARGLRGRGSGSVGEDDIERKGFKDATALGAEVGSAVGGIFKGKLWSGWGHADGADEEAQGRRRGEPSPVRGRGRDGLMGAGPSSTSTAARSMRTSGARRREWVEDGDTDRQEEVRAIIIQDHGSASLRPCFFCGSVVVRSCANTQKHAYPPFGNRCFVYVDFMHLSLPLIFFNTEIKKGSINTSFRKEVDSWVGCIMLSLWGASQFSQRPLCSLSELRPIKIPSIYLN